MSDLPPDPIALARENWRRAGWGQAADGMYAVTSVMRAQQILLARVEGVLRPFGVSFARYELLRLLAFAQEGRMAMARARSLLQVHPASVSGVVDRLEADGLVERRTHPEDARSVLLVLTARGGDVVAAATERLNAEVFEDLGLAASDLERLSGILADFRRRSGDFDDEPRG